MYFSKEKTIEFNYKRTNGFENRLEIKPVIVFRNKYDSTDKVAKGYVDGYFQTKEGEYKIQIINPRIADLLSQLEKIESSIAKEANSIIAFDENEYCSLDGYVKELEVINSKQYKKLESLQFIRFVLVLPIVLSLVVTFLSVISFLDLEPILFTRINWINIAVKYIVLFIIGYSVIRFTKEIFSSNKYDQENLLKDFRNPITRRGFLRTDD